jgi:para-nitrobenzyl esterase
MADLTRRGLLGGMTVGMLAGGASRAAPNVAPVTPAAGDNPRNDPYRAAGEWPIVVTESGKVRGYIHNGIITFKGIPYGADTGGVRRFLPPQKPAPWEGVRSSLFYGPVSPQPAREGWKHDEEAWMFNWNDCIQSEDCLRLNIWTPGADARVKRPVLVWIHGGAFSNGCAQEQPGYDGENLSRSGDVVIVSLNHRLGSVGFLNLSRFGDSYGGSGNVGMLDIVLALEWVRDNIAAFGGDQHCVTIFGQSGGGSKVSTLLAMPSATALFHRAIVQSGAALQIGTRETSQRFADEVLKELGSNGTSLDRLQAVSFSELAASGARATARLRAPGASEAMGRSPPPGDFRPFVDGNVIAQHPFDPDAPRISASVPLMVGTVLNEHIHALNHPEYESMSEESARAALVRAYGAQGGAIYDAIHGREPHLKPFDVWSQGAAGSARARALKQASLKAAQGRAPAYVYWFQWQTPVLDGRPRAFHCAEIAFAFDNAVVAGTMTGGGERAVRLARKVSQAWVHFARNGNPNHAELAKWPPYSDRQPATMVFDDVCRVEMAPDRKEQSLISSALDI